jgi:ATP-dependent exoDNAse (exonuclease V) beta subunit
MLAPLLTLAREIYARMEADSGSRALPALRLPGLAVQALGGEAGLSDALCRLGSRLSCLLLDEFQDTSRAQWAAILPLAVESLSAGGRLTYVGDVKQAIYGWRGGDARLFDAVPEEPELKAIIPRPRKRELRENWRSHPAVVAHNNAFFSLLADPPVAEKTLDAMLPRETPEKFRLEAAAMAATAYSSVRQDIPPQKQWEKDPRSAAAGVRLYMAEGKTIAAVEALVRDRMRSLFLEELPPVWKPGDVAVLVRAGDEAALVAEWLTAWGLPVVTENSFLLAAHPLVGRLISFLTFLDYPPDDLAFWEFAAGPECLGGADAQDGFAPADWLAARALDPGDRRLPLHQVFRRDFPALWESCIAPFLSGAGLMSAYDTLSEALKRFSLPERMPEQNPFLRRLLEIAHLAESRGHSSLAAFLSFWRECKEQEKLPLPENMDAVRIMTIHKAKGLEFPVVVLPFHHKGKRREPPLTATVREGLPVLTRAGREIEDVYYPACIMDELERLNLLYVAWTRPIYALHAFITRPESVSTPLTRALETLLGVYRERQIAPPCQWEDLGGPLAAQSGEPTFPAQSGEPAYPEQSDEPTWPEQAGQSTLPEERSANSPRSGPPPRPWQPMNWLPRLKIHRSPQPDFSFTPRQRGILAHLCLEQLILSPESGAELRRREVERAVRQGIRLFPLPLQDPETIAEEMAAGLAWFSSLPEAGFWLRHGLREQDILDEAGRMHRVDLLVDPLADPARREADKIGDAALYALDYKTGQEYDEHTRQIRRYMRLAALATERRVCGILVYLDLQRLVRLDAGDVLP